LLAGKGCHVTIVSRSRGRAEGVVERLVAAGIAAPARLEAVEQHGAAVAPGSPLAAALRDAEVIVAAGAAGATLLDASGRAAASAARVLVDLNAVPPAGIDGVAGTDKARLDGAAVVYGALGVGGTKMKIHRAAIARVFESTTAFLDAPDLLAIGEALEARG
jgi:hypothetical protein